MEKIKMLLGTLPEDDLRKINEWIENHTDEVPKDAYKLSDELIFNILWDYNSAKDVPHFCKWGKDK